MLTKSLLTLSMAGLVSATGMMAAPASGAQRRADNVPASVARALDVGPVDAASEITVTVQLKLQNQEEFDKAVDALYDPQSPTFHQWMTAETLKKYAPAPEQISAVRNALSSHGLAILSENASDFSIRARGPASNVQAAFNTTIHQFKSSSETFRANVTNARLSGAAGDYVSGVSGLSSRSARRLLKRAENPYTGKATATVALSKVEAAGGLGAFVTDQVLYTPSTLTLTTPHESLPTGVYFGNVYGANPNLIPDQTPATLQAHYGMPAIYKEGFNGKGQTIVLLEGYGYPTIESDANAFSALTGLPQFSASTFSIVYPEGPPASPNAGILTGWDIEIALDVQWAHAIAPGAKIVVVAAAGQDNEDFLDAMNYIINHHVGDVVNNSWEIDTDAVAGPLEEQAFDQVLKLAAAKGISFHFSSGDGGDGGLGTPIGAPGVPSNSPHATAVGGTSIVNNINGRGFLTLGWGTSFVDIGDNGVLDPPQADLTYFGGAGGGESVYFPKPVWQNKLAGKGRKVPDISALADPYTGVPIVVTTDGVQGVQFGWGGTSLACPIFTAIWAIANQKAGHSLGQAAPAIARLPVGDVLDILPASSETNVAGTIFDSSGSTFYSTEDLFTGQTYGATKFISALLPVSSSTAFVLSFGLDTSLTVTSGWDDVTGFGEPNGLPFLNGVTK